MCASPCTVIAMPRWCLSSWVSSADFGRPAMIESTVGLHSSSVFNRAVESFFRKLWSQSLEIQ